MRSPKKLQTARNILRYLVRNPEAQDTLEGIARWWLQRERIEKTVDEVHDSVQLLVTRGLIVERRGRARGISYSMNPTKRKEIAEFLKVIRSDTSSARNRTRG